MLDSLRRIKSDVEGSHYDGYVPVALNVSSLSQLKHMVLAHTPADMPEQHKAKMADLLAELLKGHVKMLLYACLLTCPWYAGAQVQLSRKANKNVLFVVYVSLDEQFFSLSTPHERGLLDTMDHVCHVICGSCVCVHVCMCVHARSCVCVCMCPSSYTSTYLWSCL